MTENERNQIITQRATGKYLEDISRDTGYSISWISTLCSQKDSKAKIKELQEQFYKEFTPVAIANYLQILTSPSPDKQDKYLRYKASKDVLDGAGFTASPTQSIYIQQIINQQNNQLILPGVQAVLDHLNKHDVIDVQSVQNVQVNDNDIQRNDNVQSQPSRAALQLRARGPSEPGYNGPDAMPDADKRS